MKFNRVVFFVFAGFASILLTACGAAPLANWPGMTSDGKNVYLANGQFVHTIQVSNGQELTTPTADGPVPLRFPLKADGAISFYGAPALTSDGQMIFGNASTLTNVHTLYSIDPSNGAVKWTFVDAKGVWIAGAAVGTDTVYAAAGDGKVYAIDFKGQKRWEASVSTDALWSSPVTDGKLVYVATLAHDVVALDPATGKQRWKKTLDNAIIGAPAISADGVLYVGTLSGNLYAFNAAEGSQIWLTKLQGGVWSTPVLDDKTLYIGTSDGTAGKFYALNTSDGKPLRNPLDDTGAIVASPLITKDQVIYVTEEGYIRFFDKNGSPSNAPVKIENAKIYTTPLLVGDLILVAPMNAAFPLAAYNQKGVQQWTFIPK
jgi:outer membrane protein assembly factor BamB